MWRFALCKHHQPEKLNSTSREEEGSYSVHTPPLRNSTNFMCCCSSKQELLRLHRFIFLNTNVWIYPWPLYLIFWPCPVFGLAEMESIFFTAAHMVLYFGSVTKTVLVTHQCIGYCPAYLHSFLLFPIPFISYSQVGQGWARSWSGRSSWPKLSKGIFSATAWQ